MSVTVYLRKLTATNDVFLNDPTAFAVAAVVVQGGAGTWKRIEELRDRQRRELQEEEELIVLISCLIAEEECRSLVA